jgi:putative toxin-antitoxin system antitoxin component (TIGR02293 family)
LVSIEDFTMPQAARTAWVSPTRATTTMDYVNLVREGLPIEVADSLSDEICPGDSTFKYLFVPKATYARRKSSTRLSASESEKLVRVGRMWAFAAEVWGGADKARRFVTTPHMLLDGKTPLTVTLDSELGGKMVEEILGRLAYGSAV